MTDAQKQLSLLLRRFKKTSKRYKNAKKWAEKEIRIAKEQFQVAMELYRDAAGSGDQQGQPGSFLTRRAEWRQLMCKLFTGSDTICGAVTRMRAQGSREIA